MKMKSILCSSLLALFSSYCFSQAATPASAPIAPAAPVSNSTKITVNQDVDYSQAGVHTRMPIDSEKYINGQLVKPKGNDAPAMGADASPAPVFTTMEAASQAGINPLATQNVEVPTNSAEITPYIEEDNFVLDWIRQNKDGIIAGTIILLIGLGLSYYNRMRTLAQLKEIEEDTDSQQDD